MTTSKFFYVFWYDAKGNLVREHVKAPDVVEAKAIVRRNHNNPFIERAEETDRATFKL